MNETEKRKADHIRICLEKKPQAKQATTGFEDVYLVHNAVPEVDMESIKLSTTVFTHRFAAPLIVGALTGGTPEAQRINSTIAEAVETLGLGMGVGSQRAAIENARVAETFAVARKKAPTAFLVANIGGIQLAHGYGLKEIKRAVEAIDADAVAVHLNALQEAVQPEGQTGFKGVVSKLKELVDTLDLPVIVKETGCGIAAEEARRLEALGVNGIDVSGLGGTSFAAVEYYRAIQNCDTVRSTLGEAFWDWGIPTVASLVETVQTVKLPVIASGGVRTGVDAAKALALGASLVSFSQPVLEVAVKSVEETRRLLSIMVEALKTAMFLVGAEEVAQLARKPLVITGRTAKWLKTRGFNVEAYARRRPD